MSAKPQWVRIRRRSRSHGVRSVTTAAFDTRIFEHLFLDVSVAGDVTREATNSPTVCSASPIQPDQIDPTMAARAVSGLVKPDVIAAALATLYTDVADEVGQRP